MKKALFAALVLVILVAPAISFAAGIAGPLVQDPTVAGPNTGGAAYTLCDLRVLANNIIDFAVVLSVFVATLMFAYGGILYVTGPAGGEAQIKKAHSVLLNAVVGILIVLLAWLIINIVLSVLTGQGATFWTQFTCEANPTAAAFPAADQTPANNNNNTGTTKPPANLKAPTGSCVATSQALATQVNATSNCNPAQRVANYGSGTTVVNNIQNNFGTIIDQCANGQGVPPNVLVAISGIECNGQSTCNDPSNTAIPCQKGGYGATQVTCSEVAAYCRTSSDAACSGFSSLTPAQQVARIQTTPKLSFCTTAYAMKNQYAQYGDWGNAAVAYNGGAGALSASASCPGYVKMQCPIASANQQFPYCNITCAYHDAFENYLTSAGGTGADFKNYFEQYMALADSIKKTHE